MKSTIIRAVTAGLFAILLLVSGPAAASDPAIPDAASAEAEVSSYLGDEDRPVDCVTLSRSLSLLAEQGVARSREMAVTILKREKPVAIAQGAPLPGAMSPLDMLKAAALDALGKLRAHDQLDLMKEVYSTSGEAILRRIAKENIEALGGSVEE